MKVGVVGLGAIGRKVCEALDAGIPGLTLAAVTARDRARGERFAGAGRYYYASVSSFLPPKAVAPR